MRVSLAQITTVGVGPVVAVVERGLFTVVRNRMRSTPVL